MLGGQHAAADHPIGRRPAYVQNICGFIKGNLTALGSFALAIDGIELTRSDGRKVLVAIEVVPPGYVGPAMRQSPTS